VLGADIDAPGAFLDDDLDARQLARSPACATASIDTSSPDRRDDDVARDVGDADAAVAADPDLAREALGTFRRQRCGLCARTVAVRTTSRRTTGLSGPGPGGTAAIATPAITNDTVSRMVSYLLS
jgi:hypothetical protein